MDHLRQDLRYALRSLIARPGFTAVVVVTLGLGIGINSAIFTLVNAAILRPLPVRAPEEIVNVYMTGPNGANYSSLSYPDYRDVGERTDLFQDVVAYGGLMATLMGNGQSEMVFGEVVSANYFSALGVVPQLGRGFVPEEGAAVGTHPVVVISPRLWQRWFNGAPDVVGRELRLNGVTLTVVGVTPDDFSGVLARGFSLDVWLPIAMREAVLGSSSMERRDNRWVNVKGRLQPGVTPDRVRASLATLMGGLREAYPETHEGREFRVIPMNDVYLHPEGDSGVVAVAAVMMSAVGLVLLIACTNVANLLLARAMGRRREIAVRLALGAGRRRLVQQLLFESVLLAGGGGIIGFTLAYWLAALLLAFNPPFPVAITLDLTLDWRVVTFTGGVSLLTGLVFGLIPALQATRPDLVSALKDQESGARVGKMRIRNALLLPQVAISLVLLIVAGLFARSVQNASSVDLGFDGEEAAIVTVDLSDMPGYDAQRARLFWADLLDRAKATPGVRRATVSSWIPLGILYSEQSVRVLTSDPAGTRTLPGVVVARTDEDYFATLGIAVRGRAFSAGEVERTAPVAIVSEAAARRLWPDESPLGKRLRTGSEEGAEYEVVGVAADGKVRTLGEDPQPFLYLPVRRYTPMMHLIAAAPGDPAAVVAALRRQVAEIDSDVAVFQSMTMEEHLSLMLFPFRMAAGVSVALGLLGLTLAAVGLYGVVSYGVAQRTREMGLRMALGADARDVVRLVVGEGMRVVLVGVVVGLGLAFLMTRVLSSALFGINPSDPVTFVVTPTLLAAVAAVASFLPARRATKVDPVRALRTE